MLFLILVFINTIFIFLILGAEFLAISISIIYVGAISILFPFVVTSLNLRVVELYSPYFSYLPIGTFLGILSIFESIIVLFYGQSVSIYIEDNYLLQ